MANAGFLGDLYEPLESGLKELLSPLFPASRAREQAREICVLVGGQGFQAIKMKKELTAVLASKQVSINNWGDASPQLLIASSRTSGGSSALQSNSLRQKRLDRGSDKNMPAWTERGWGLLNSSITGVVLRLALGWMCSVLKVRVLASALKVQSCRMSAKRGSSSILSLTRRYCSPSSMVLVPIIGDGELLMDSPSTAKPQNQDNEE